ncbi:GGDEF domain-containing protein [Ampullimonas aquatilis]|uniref:GGDEF domain-containing protein n=1 Tax=Ampullimonas aquatilis TaxID=1341549 RepID=UPI003C758A8F
MKYQETKEQSAELLRMVITRMSQQDAPLHPISYAIWYEYLSGSNPSLKQAMDQIMAEEGKLNDEIARQLYEQHIVLAEEAMAMKASNEFQRILVKISDATGKTEDATENYGNHLTQWMDSIKAATTPDALSQTAAGLLNDTNAIRHAIHDLSENLTQSRDEVNALKEQLEHARNEALQDGLTGLLNRRGFDQNMAQFAQNFDELPHGLSLVMVDLDHFKKINDTYGHLFGDKVLRSIAQILKVATEKVGGIVARYGGEEFAAIFPQSHIDQVFLVMDQIRLVVASSKIRRIKNGVNENIGGISISAGVAHCGKKMDLAELITRADKALYQAKNAGRNQVVIAAA